MKVYVGGTERLVRKVVSFWVDEDAVTAYIDNDINKKL